jgi:hypothetical protein
VRDLILYVRVLSTETGVWCPRCFLPSAVTVGSVVSFEPVSEVPTGPAMMSTTLCPDCGWTDA